MKLFLDRRYGGQENGCEIVAVHVLLLYAMAVTVL
jgi:hypothetical protein